MVTVCEAIAGQFFRSDRQVGEVIRMSFIIQIV